MTTLSLTATFQGADGSLGYKAGQEYNIELFSGLYGGKPVNYLRVVDQQMEMVAYESPISFLTNWTNIKTRA